METTDTLFDRLGGTKGIAALVDDIVVTHMENPTVRARFLPMLENPERLAVIKQHTVQFFEMGSGAPPCTRGAACATPTAG